MAKTEQKKQPFVAAIDPAIWLKRQAPAPARLHFYGLAAETVPPPLQAGFEALEAFGDVRLAMTECCDLHAEIVLAHLMRDSLICQCAKEKILAVAQMMDGICEN